MGHPPSVIDHLPRAIGSAFFSVRAALVVVAFAYGNPVLLLFRGRRRTG